MAQICGWENIDPQEFDTKTQKREGISVQDKVKQKGVLINERSHSY